MARVVVVQLGRVGDLVQSLYLCRDLKEAEGHEVSIVADAAHLPLLGKLAPWVNVHPLNAKSHLRGRESGEGPDGLGGRVPPEPGGPGVYPFDRVINLSPGQRAGTLARRLTEPGRVEGFLPSAQRTCEDPREDPVPGLIRNGGRWNRLHRVDAYRSYACRRLPPLERTPPPGTRRAGGTLAVDLAVLGTKRTLQEEALAALVRGLREEADVEILLLGQAGGAGPARRVLREAAGGRVRDLVGKLSPSDLVDILEGCRALLTGDTGTLHLAAWLGVPTVALFSGPAGGFRTGPYGNGHTLVHVDAACSQAGEAAAPGRAGALGAALCPEDVRALLLGERPPPRDGLRVYRSVFVDRWLQYCPVHRSTAAPEDVLGLVHLSGLAEYLEAPPGRFPGREAALGFLVAGYRLDDPGCFPDAGSLGASLPRGLRPEARHRRMSVLTRNLARLEEIRRATFLYKTKTEEWSHATHI
jgi:hypothetical protein